MQFRKASVSAQSKQEDEPVPPPSRRRIVVGGGLAVLAVAAGIAGERYIKSGRSIAAPAVAQTQPASASTVPWVAAAPGRVEPRSGMVRIAAGAPGRVEQVYVRQGDKVEDGDLLLRVEDAEPRARLAAAEAEVEARRKERDDVPVTKGREDVRRAEDGIYAAERTVTNARLAVDQMLAGRGTAGFSEQFVVDARKRLAEARDKLKKEHASYALAQSKGNIPPPSRLESAVIAARADVSVADALLDKTRVRAPITGTILVVNVKAGETVAPSVELPLVAMGDVSVVRVRAEVDEHDVAKIKMGQKAFVKTNAHAGKEFNGKVIEIAPSLALPKMTGRGPRRPTDVEVMEVVVELEGPTPLLPGMRADTFFRKE